MANPIPIMLMVRELNLGGCERDLAKLTKALDRSLFTPHVGVLLPGGVRTAELEAVGVPITCFPVNSFQSWSAIQSARQMSRYLHDNHIQLIHCFDVPTCMFGVPVAYFSRTPVIVSAQLGERELFSRLYRQILRMSDRMSDVVVANSRYIQQCLIERDHVPPERTYLCLNSVDTNIFHPSPDPKPDCVATAPLVIGTVSALRTEKRLDLLVKAFAQVRHLLPGMKLLIVGSGVVLPQLEALRDELGIAADCIFEPAKTEVAPWMRALDIYVMCSESESLPNALIEAMACGCACVGSHVGGIPELITDNVSGLLFENKNVESLAAALSKLILDPALRGRFAEQASTFARETFSLETNLRCNTTLYQTLLARKGIPASGTST